jgi:hypothetical protein
MISVSLGNTRILCARKMLATISKLLLKLRDRINLKGSCNGLRNTVKELGFQQRTNNRVVIIRKHDVRCM